LVFSFGFGFSAYIARKPILSRLVVEKEILQSLTVKNEEVKLSEARLRWEEVKVSIIFTL
jgi:hypothetical protein